MATLEYAQPFNAFAQGRAVRQDEDYANSRNALAKIETEAAPERIRQENALAGLRVKGAQMDIDAATANTGYTKLRQALDSSNPREYVLRHEPGLAQKVAELGVDLRSADDETVAGVLDGLAREYAGKAGIAPEPKPVQFETINNADGSVLQKDPITGELKQVMGRAPREPAAPKGPARFVTMSPEEVAAAGLPVGTSAQRNEETGQINVIGKPGKTATTDNTEATVQKLDSANNTLSAIRDVKAKLGWNTTGVIGQFNRQFAGTEASDMEADLDTIKANIGFDRLQMMRDASKTGGALGGIAVQELNLLQSTIASLNVKQGKENLAKNLEKVERQYEKAVKAYEAALGIKSSGGATASWGDAPAADELKPGMVVDGYRYNGGDPGQQSSWVRQ